MKLTTIGAMIKVAIESAWTGGSPFAVQTVLYPPNEDSKYVIESEGLRLAFTLYGGALSNLWINDTNGVERDIVLGYDHADEYRKYTGNPYLNGVIGRYAGIISGAGFSMQGMHYNTSPNANDGTATYNGGERGWGRRKVDVASHSADSITFVVFDREWNGFPGKPAACITHSLRPYEWQVGIGFVAVKTPSPVSMSQQVFWNLDGLSNGSRSTVKNHKLRLPYSGMRFDIDKEGVPSGDIKGNLKGSVHDFWSGKRRIGDVLTHTTENEAQNRVALDETFLITRSQPWKREDGPAAILESDNSGITVELFTDQDALHVHTWMNSEDKVTLKKTQGSGTAPELGAISMEMQNWPDAVSHAEWQKDVIYGTDRIYSSLSSFKFKVKGSSHLEFSIKIIVADGDFVTLLGSLLMLALFSCSTLCPTSNQCYTMALALPAQAVLAAFMALLATLVFFVRSATSDVLSHIPVIGNRGTSEEQRKQFLFHVKQLYEEGYQQHKNGLFRLISSDKSQSLVLSSRYLEELRKLPDTTISVEAAVRDTMEGKYTGSPGKGSLIVTPQTIKGDLNPALPRINQILSKEVDEAVEEAFGHCSSWTPVNVNSALLRTVAIVSGRVFIGPELYRKEPYIEASTQYTMELLAAQRAVKAIDPWLRPLYAPFLPELKALESRVAAADRFLRPVVQARREEAERTGKPQQHDDFLAWMMNNAVKFDIKSDREIARIQLAISFAAIHTTTMTATNVFYNLAARTQYIEPLRREATDALAVSDGIWTTQALSSLHKLDSFIRETMRLDPVFFNAFRRKVLRPFELSDGTFIPANTMIEIPYYGITRDPSIFSNPDQFDGFRFLEDDGKSTERNGFVAITSTNLTFGYGRHACPGRFFATNEIKMIVARMLLDYDVRLEGESGERYKNLEFGTTSVPDPSKKLLFRRKQRECSVS